MSLTATLLRNGYLSHTASGSLRSPPAKACSRELGFSSTLHPPPTAGCRWSPIHHRFLAPSLPLMNPDKRMKHPRTVPKPHVPKPSSTEALAALVTHSWTPRRETALRQDESLCLESPSDKDGKGKCPEPKGALEGTVRPTNTEHRLTYISG